MGNFLIPGGLYRIYYRRHSKKKEQKPLQSYRALILLVKFGGERRIYRHQDLKKECQDKHNFTYEAIEMNKHCAPERFSISPGDIAKSVLLKRLKDMRDWPLEAVRVYFSRRGVGRDHVDELYNRDMQLENVDFARFHVRAALRQRRTLEKLKKKQAKKVEPGMWIDANYTGIEDGYLNFSLTVADLEPVIYRFGRDSNIESVIYRSDEHLVTCHDEDGEVVHRMSPQWPFETVREAFERQRARAERAGTVESVNNWTGAVYHGSASNWATTNSTTNS